jgi:hypothetical protein
MDNLLLILVIWFLLSIPASLLIGRLFAIMGRRRMERNDVAIPSNAAPEVVMSNRTDAGLVASRKRV